MGTVADPRARELENMRRQIRSALSWMPPAYRTPDAIELLLRTAVAETRLGKFPDRPGSGGVGIFQVNPKTEEHIWESYLRKRPALAKKLGGATGVAGPNPEALARNFPYAAAMARLAYTRALAPIPPARDVEGQARYWKEYYNTSAGKGTPEKFLEAYYDIIGGQRR